MSTQFAVQTVIEILLIALVVFSFVKEKSLIAFEEKLMGKLRRRTKKAGVIVAARKRGAHCA